jgi:hypothetical protein
MAIIDIDKCLKRAEASLRLDSNRDPLSVARQMPGGVPIPSGSADEETSGVDTPHG